MLFYAVKIKSLIKPIYKITSTSLKKLKSYHKEINIIKEIMKLPVINVIKQIYIKSFFVVENFNIALNKVDFIGAISFS